MFAVFNNILNEKLTKSILFNTTNVNLNSGSKDCQEASNNSKRNKSVGYKKFIILIQFIILIMVGILAGYNSLDRRLINLNVLIFWNILKIFKFTPDITVEWI